MNTSCCYIKPKIRIVTVRSNQPESAVVWPADDDKPLFWVLILVKAAAASSSAQLTDDVNRRRTSGSVNAFPSASLPTPARQNELKSELNFETLKKKKESLLFNLNQKFPFDLLGCVSCNTCTVKRCWQQSPIKQWLKFPCVLILLAYLLSTAEFFVNLDKIMPSNIYPATGNEQQW